MPKATPMIGLMSLDRAAYPNLNNTAFKVLCRIAYLSNGKTDAIAYSTADAINDFKCSKQLVPLILASLRKNGYISSNTVKNVRYVALSAEAKLAPISVLDTPHACAGAPAHTYVGTGAGARTGAHAGMHARARLENQDRQPFFEYLNEQGYRTPTFLLRDNAYFLNYVDDPLLAPIRENLLQFDLSKLVKASGLKLTPFGKSHSWQFDFTPLQELLDHSNLNMSRMVEKFPKFNGYHFFAAHYLSMWKEFFIFYMLIELTAGLGDCFFCQSEFDPFGSNFMELWYENQRGTLWSCLNACYSTDKGTYPLASRITSTFMPTKETSILAYAQTCIKNELVDLINNPVTAEKCFLAFRAAVIDYGSRQLYVDMAQFKKYAGPDWLDGIWGTNLKMNLLNYENQYFTPRICWPLILFRTLVSIHTIAKLGDGFTEERNDIASVALYHSFRGQSAAADLAKLSKVLAPYFPFFNQVEPLLKSFEDKENEFYGIHF